MYVCICAYVYVCMISIHLSIYRHIHLQRHTQTCRDTHTNTNIATHTQGSRQTLKYWHQTFLEAFDSVLYSSAVFRMTDTFISLQNASTSVKMKMCNVSQLPNAMSRNLLRQLKKKQASIERPEGDIIHSTTFLWSREAEISCQSAANIARYDKWRRATSNS